MHATQVDTLLPFKAKAHTQAKEIERLRDETAAMHKALQESEQALQDQVWRPTRALSPRPLTRTLS